MGTLTRNGLRNKIASQNFKAMCVTPSYVILIWQWKFKSTFVVEQLSFYKIFQQPISNLPGNSCTIFHSSCPIRLSLIFSNWDETSFWISWMFFLINTRPNPSPAYHVVYRFICILGIFLKRYSKTMFWKKACNHHFFFSLSCHIPQ